MRTSLLCFVACAVVVPLGANADGDPIATCHLAYTWGDPAAKDLTTIANAKDYRLTPEQIARLPRFREVKITVNDGSEVASTTFKGEIICETESDVISYEGTFDKAFFRDTFASHGEPVVVLPTALPKKTVDEAPSRSVLPPGLECRWDGDTTAPGESFGVVVQLYDRHTQWLRARFTGTCTKKSKSWMGGTSTQEFHDAQVIFPANHAVTAVMMASAPFRF